MADRVSRALDLCERIQATIERDVSPTWEKVACLEWITGAPDRTVATRSGVEVDTARAAMADAARNVASKQRAAIRAGAFKGAPDDLADAARRAEHASKLAGATAEQRTLQRAAEHETIVRARHVPAVVKHSPKPWDTDREHAPEGISEADAIRDARERARRGLSSGVRDLATVAESVATWRAPDAFKVAAAREGARLDAADLYLRAEGARLASGEQASHAGGRDPKRRSTRGGSDAARERRKARRAAERAEGATSGKAEHAPRIDGMPRGREV